MELLEVLQLLAAAAATVGYKIAIGGLVVMGISLSVLAILKIVIIFLKGLGATKIGSWKLK